STALRPPAPVPSTTARSSASDSALAPRVQRRSRGRSASGQSMIVALACMDWDGPDEHVRASLRSSVNSGATPSPSTTRMNARDEFRSITRVVLGLTGGIAAYKAAELTRLFVQAGVTVDVVMTPAA